MFSFAFQKRTADLPLNHISSLCLTLSLFPPITVTPFKATPINPHRPSHLSFFACPCYPSSFGWPLSQPSVWPLSPLLAGASSNDQSPSWRPSAPPLPAPFSFKPLSGLFWPFHALVARERAFPPLFPPVAPLIGAQQARFILVSCHCWRLAR